MSDKCVLHRPKAPPKPRAPRPIENLVGQRFGKLVVKQLVGKDGNGHPLWRCFCDCGSYTDARAHSLKGKRHRSCGCSRRGPFPPRPLLPRGGVHGSWLGVL